MSFWCMQTDYVQATIYYLLSSFLDAFDGHAARMLNQGTVFTANFLQGELAHCQSKFLDLIK